MNGKQNVIYDNILFIMYQQLILDSTNTVTCFPNCKQKLLLFRQDKTDILRIKTGIKEHFNFREIF